MEFITSVHLFHMFPDLEEGGLATYRAALVQNQHLAILAEVLGKSLYELKSVLKTKSSKYSGYMHYVAYHIIYFLKMFSVKVNCSYGVPVSNPVARKSSHF